MSPDSKHNPLDAAAASVPTPEPRVWHYVLDDSAFGPATASDLRDLASRGLIDPASLVWRDEWAAWREIRDVPDLVHLVAFSAGGSVGDEATLEPPPAAVPVIVPKATLQSTTEMMLLRLAAAVIDQAIIFIPTLLLAAPAMAVLLGPSVTPAQLFQLGMADPKFWLLQLCIWVPHWAYSSLLESSAIMATFGKRACGLCVVDTRGRRISFARASARYWSRFPFAALLYVGYGFAAFTGGRRAPHDIIAGTIVRKGRR